MRKQTPKERLAERLGDRVRGTDKDYGSSHDGKALNPQSRKKPALREAPADDRILDKLYPSSPKKSEW